MAAPIGQQLLKHVQARFLVAELAAQAGDVCREIRIQRLRFGIGIFRPTQARSRAEIEFVGIELADLGQALAQRIQAQRARLQRSQLHGECIQIALGRRFELNHVLPLRLDLRLQGIKFVQRAALRVGEQQGRRETGAAETQDA